MAQVVFSGTSGTIPNLNQNFTQNYDLREFVTTPGYAAATPRLYIDSVTTFSAGTVSALGVEKSAPWCALSARAYSISAAAGGILVLGRSKSATLGTLLATASGDTLGLLAFEGVNSGNTAVAGAYFQVVQDGAAGASSIPGRLEIYTSDGTALPARRFVFDGLGNLLGVGSGALGYGTGSGGAVNQATSKSAAVTLNKSNGAITMQAASLAATTSVSFVLTNSLIAATDVVNVSIKSGATLGAYLVQVDATAAGTCTITLRNYTAGALAEAVVLNFAVIKAVTS